MDPDKFEQYLKTGEMYSFECYGGVRKMEKLMKEVCGYNDSWGGSLGNFFSYNPGAMHAVIEWITDQTVSGHHINLTNKEEA